jgi:hypothetical protein
MLCLLGAVRAVLAMDTLTAAAELWWYCVGKQQVADCHMAVLPICAVHRNQKCL